jgi:hypothetical protein
MRVERIHRWQWVIIAVIVGFLIGYVRNLFTGEAVSGYGNSMNGQQQFENAMLTHERLPNGETRPLFYKLVVVNIKDPTAQPRSPDEIRTMLTADQKKKLEAIKKTSDQFAYLREVAEDEANHRRTYAIAGVYYNGRPSPNPKTNQWEKVWHPYFYIAPYPYKPSRQFAVSGTVPPIQPTMTDKLQALAEKVHLKDPDPADSVLAYLKGLKAQGRIDYSYEWWRAPRVSMAAWIAGCLVVIGGLWPTLVNLLVYGTLSQPLEAKAQLGKASTTTTKAPSGPTDADLAQLKALEEELEAKLAASATSTPMGPSDQPTPAPVKTLTAKELEVAAATAKAAEDRLFAAKADDFYPTEKRVSHKDE